MNNQDTEQFLDTYRRLETAAEKLVGTDSRGGSILRLAQHRDFIRYQDELDYCRQVRNLLSHEAKIGGEYGVHPSPSLQAVLDEVLRLAEQPPVAADVMTPATRLLLARPTDKVLPMMAQMRQRGLSFVPLLTEGRVTGIFSADALFRWVLDGNPPWDGNTAMAHLLRYLSLDRPAEQGIAFVPPSLPCRDAADLFDGTYEQNHKLKLLLVTRRGEKDGKLLGVISPYDLLDQNNG